MCGVRANGPTSAGPPPARRRRLPMCGIAGWVDYDRDLTQEREIAWRMTSTMARRGPDADGLWLSPRAAMGHRRLAIIDLEGGRQPMIAAEGGAPLAVLSYSGEVYNFRELRA